MSSERTYSTATYIYALSRTV